jgi:short-subunit dehydrogenase
MKTSQEQMKNESVLITGASTGIGYSTAIYLDKMGFNVYACVRKEADKKKLQENSSKRLKVLILDVCDPNSIHSAYEHIQRITNDETFHLINNAGLSINGPLELLDYSEIKKVIDVNLTGLLTVTNIFLPLIRRSKGRIINISSGHGLLAIPDKSVYAASKFGVQAVCDSLRVELKPFEVEVISIIVGKVNTSVLDKILDGRRTMIEKANTESYEVYKSLIEYFEKEVKNIPGIEAVKVSEIIGKALTDKKPKVKYIIGPGAKKMDILRKFPAKMRDKMLFNAVYKS